MPKEIEGTGQAAVKRRRQRRQLDIDLAQAPNPREMLKKRESGVTGVTWDSDGLAWRAYICLKGQRLGKVFAPKDLSDESVEEARLLAVQHRRDLELRRRDTSKASSSAVPQPAPAEAAVTTKGSKQGKRAVCVQAKPSGASAGGQVKRRKSSAQRDVEPSGMDSQDPDLEALEDAIAFRDSLIKDAAAEAASAKSQAGKRGVFWHRGCWHVQIRVEGKDLNGGRFRPRDDTPEEIEIARLAAEECRRKLEVPHFPIQTKVAADPSEMQKKKVAAEPSKMQKKKDAVEPGEIQRRHSGVPGITWDAQGLHWRSYISVKGQRIGKAFRPKDMSEESVETARLEAVQFRRDLERRCRDTSKASR